MEINNAGMRQPLVLAYMGDCIYELYVREYLINKYQNIKVNDLHKKAINFVKAKSQAMAIINIESELTEKEKSIVKRARNQKSNTVPKNADIIDYKYATAFEALIGYLHLNKENERMEHIINKAIEIIDNGM
ncbi:Mini-ribonuclease 3 [Alkalithermobacter paradoxus]|uniref:Mini-ribonuclease 3 n=1 Tax=Alkalithermobacter paradoxus TaxID=29349 RepID=A0A1V4I4L5_9FIRM|nr:mini-ribonuclease 3 [[Clostridium] thermoalcaliphilum]